MLSRGGCVVQRGLCSSVSAVLQHSAGSGLILQSLSTDVYQNLALEDWIHDAADLQDRGVLLMWRSRGAVVVGRHQNPWQEADLPVMRDRGVPLARRRSGGGTVFHDLGNINFTFFTSKKNYDRHRNLGVVTGALKALRPGLDVRATERFDILLGGRYKISGTAAKLGRTSAYHHCTLLCSADRRLLSAVLKPTSQGIKSNATPSVPSPVQNLLDQDPSLDSETIQNAVADQYNSEFGFRGPVRQVDPSDELMFPGISRLTLDLQTWDWRFGRTPPFSLQTSLQLRDRASQTLTKATVTMEIKSGIIERCDLDVPSDWLPGPLCEELGSMLVGGRFCPSQTAAVSAALLRSSSQSPAVLTRLQNLCENVAALM
ncbi:lipoyl amidotransferase LIPT1, mitochondrial [Polymixia lowei]